ncbi:MAG: tetrahydromethanopterin S-methyltransferase subunit MtrG [Methanosarcinales archaeon]
MNDYEKIMQRLDKIEEQVEFTSAEIIQRRGVMIGRLIGILYGALIALIIIFFMGWI